MQLAAHQLSTARQVHSPNQDARPGGEADISLIVIHGISLPPGEFGGPEIEALFTNTLADTPASARPDLADLINIEVSSHLLIRRAGELVQFVRFDARAWHAGESVFGGRARCNDFAIGIELEGADDLPYEAAQYQVLGSVCRLLMAGYGITEIRGHEHIAPGRKTDPGPAFDWLRLQRLLAHRQ